MTADEFRRLALSLPEAAEGSHMDHADFRVCGKIFASLGPDATWGMVKLTPEQQTEFVADEPTQFQPITGAWGHRGYTRVELRAAKKPVVREALMAAWTNTAPKKLAAGSLSTRSSGPSKPPRQTASKPRKKSTR